MPTFQNQATLYSNNSVTRSNVVTGQINETVVLTKTAVSGEYAQGDNVTYVITLVNNSSAAVNDIILTDDLGGYEFNDTILYPLEYVEDSALYYINGVLQNEVTVSGTQPLVISGISVPANGNAMIIYESSATVFADPTVGGSITNTVGTENGCVDATAQTTITASEEPNLSISKFVWPGEVNECSEITYTFVIQNYGNTPATEEDGIYIVDEFDPAIDITSVLIDGNSFTLYTYEDGVFTTTPGAITVPAATYEQDPITGTWIIIPGVTTLTVTGTI